MRKREREEELRQWGMTGGARGRAKRKTVHRHQKLRVSRTHTGAWQRRGRWEERENIVRKKGVGREGGRWLGREVLRLSG